MYVTSDPIVIVTPSEIPCIAKGYSIPIRVKTPYNPYSNIEAVISLGEDEELTRGIKLLDKTTMEFTDDNSKEN